MALRKIDLEDGKYTVLHNEEHGGVTVLRHGKVWRNETGDKFILAMIQRIVELQEDNVRLEAELEEVTEDRNIWRSNSLDWEGEDDGC